MQGFICLFRVQSLRSRVCMASVKLIGVLFLLFTINLLRAQDKPNTITGFVRNDKGIVLPGVTVINKVTNKVTTTDEKGRYLLPGIQGQKIEFSFIGYEKVTAEYKGDGLLDITMSESELKLEDAVVVTALGISRQKRSLAYAVQELKGDDVNKSKTTGLINNLSGKVAGLQVTSSNGAPGSSSYILIRGNSSIGGNNQPLFVVDGVPIDNGNYGSGTSVDYGNGANAINSEDIASMSVLKGPQAAALYGSRGANGVILITTKNGKGSKGIGISVNSNSTFENPFRMPEWQNSYGQGQSGEFKFVDGKGGGVNDGVDESWGPKIDGQLIPQFDSPVSDDGTRTATPWSAHPNNWKDFFNTGKTYNNNIAFSGGSDKGDFRVSLGHVKTDGILPNTDYYRTNVAINAGYKLTPKLNIRTSATYINDGSHNRTNWALYMIWFGRQVDISKLKDYLLPNSIDQYNWNYNYWSNPYYALYASTKPNQKDRLYGNISATYDFTDWMSLMVRTGTDFSNDRQEVKNARFNSAQWGSYSTTQIFVRENNSDFLLNLHPKLTGEFTVTGNIGGNTRYNYYEREYMYASQLAIPNIFNMGNSIQRPTTENSYTKKKVNSLYASANLGYKNYLFVDLTARNDWSSTLPSNNNSYFYPSVAVSGILTDILRLKSNAFSFWKLRAGMAKVGNDTDPYKLRQTYSFGDAWGSLSNVSASTTLYTADLKPEITTSIEIGSNMQFFKNRLGLDITYYDQSTKNQILGVNISNASGYASKLLNAGKINNKGLEVQLHVRPLSAESKFQWEMDINYARNKNKVIELADGLVNYQLGTIRGMSIEARVGQPYGTFFGSQFLRDDNGKIVYSNGLPQKSSVNRNLGNFNPNWTGGIGNTFTYNNFQLYVLVDAKWGGKLFSQTVNIGRYTGVLKETAEGTIREDGIIGDGVKNTGTSDNPVYVANDVRVSAENYFHSYYQLTNNEVAIFDATFVKLRQMRLSYTVPRIGKALRNVAFALVGNNLLLIHSNVPHIDPESSYYGSATNVRGVESGQILSTRSYGLNVSFSL